MDKIRHFKKGIRFVYKSKYDNKIFFGVIDEILLTGDEPSILSERGISYKLSEVELIEDWRDKKFKELGI